MKSWFFGILILLFPGLLQNEPKEDNKIAPFAHIDPPYINIEDPWIDSLLDTMSLEEKLGQLMMIAAYSNKDETHYKQIEGYIKKYKIGGLIFMQGTPDKQIELLNRYQAASKVPLMVGFDGEWGLSMRLKNTTTFPRQLMLGAIKDDSVIYQMGYEFGKQMKRVGININFAPDIDVNNNANNPVINDRSFGENKYNVARKGLLYMRGLQDAGVMACGKHFPGHGDTEVDSHKDLPQLNHSRVRLDSVELYPFRALIPHGIGSIMVAHLNIPSLDSTPNLPSTLSKKIVTSLLREELKFEGLIFTDAMNMGGITKFYKPGQGELAALKAGNDILLFPENVDSAVQVVVRAVKNGEISEKIINEKVRKVLKSKVWMNLKTYKPITQYKLDEDINNSWSSYLKEKIISSAITLVKDNEKMVPVGNLAKEKIACITIGKTSETAFTKMLDKYGKVDQYFISKDAARKDFDFMATNTINNSYIIVNVQDMSAFSSKNFGLTNESIFFIEKISKNKKVLLVLFGTPYALVKFPSTKNIIIAYNEDDITQSMTAQIIFGGRAAKGRLPVSAGNNVYGDGLNSLLSQRLRYGSSWELGVDPADLKGIDSIAKNAISIGATPGCQVLAAKDGLVFYEKSFGKHTYENDGRLVQNSDIYDIASLTKVTATLPLVMKLVEDSIVDLDKTIGNYIKMPDTTDKKRLVLREVLAHQSGLVAWIPFYKRYTDKNDKPDPFYFQFSKDNTYDIRICDGVYQCYSIEDSIWNAIYKSELGNKTYKYSDLGFFFMKKMVEQQLKSPIETNDQRYFYNSLGMNKTMYRPREKGISLSTIPPSEIDNYFRNRKIHGDVHDPGAAMLGGVGGHAGLFSNANDLAKYFQMLLNQGTFGGLRFLKSATIAEFTRKQYSGSRRGLGFDKPEMEKDNGPTCKSASAASFGHTGFTGTIAWADPVYNMLNVFLSNRTFPSQENKLLVNKDVRPKIQQEIYNAILKAPKKMNP